MTVLLPFVGEEKKENQDERRKHTEEAVRSPYEYARPEPSAIIPIDPVRNLIRTFSYGSFQGSWRTAVVLHADKMGLEAANALLKTLEEPPAQSILILTAPSQKTVLPTIASRCQFFRLSPVSTPILAAYLEENGGATPENAVFIAELSGGNIRLAITIASDEAHQTQDRALRFLTALLEGRDPQTFVALQQLAAEKGDVFDVLKSAEVWLRDVLHFRVAGPDGIVNRHRLSDVEQLARAMTNDTIRVLAEEIERVREMNRRNINLQISLVELWRRTRSTAGSI
jgi:DNA polymerase-3 subunit delta'